MKIDLINERAPAALRQSRPATLVTDILKDVSMRDRRIYGYQRFYIGNQLIEDLSEDGSAKSTYEAMIKGEIQGCWLPQPHVKTIYHMGGFSTIKQKIQDDTLACN